MTRPLAIVTGGNRGIGLEVCRQLAKRGHRVLLTSRREPDGEAAAAGLFAQGLQVSWRRLDVADPASIASFVARLKGEGALVDVLVNNAGVYGGPGGDEGFRRTIEVNFFGALRVTDALAPLLALGARVVNVSSGMGELSGLPFALRRRFEAPPDREALVRAVEGFVGEAERGAHGRDPSLAYRVSKCALNVLSRLDADALARRGVRVNAVSPGWVRTAMGGAGAPRDVAEGAASVVWAATLPSNGPTGGFFQDGRPLDW